MEGGPRQRAGPRLPLDVHPQRPDLAGQLEREGHRVVARIEREGRRPQFGG